MKKKFYIILLLLVLIVPFTYCKYTESFTSHVTLSVRNPNYDVIFHSNNGTDDTTVQHFVYGTSDNLTLNTFTNGIYSFDGWTTNSDGSGTIYDDGALVSNLSSIDGDEFNLFAKWGVPVYTVTYTGVSSDGLPSNVNDGDDLIVTLPSTNYEIVSISINGENTTDYTYSAGVITVNDVTGDVVISVRETLAYEFVIDPETGETEITGGTITPENPISFTEIDGREFFGLNNSENIIDSLNICATYKSILFARYTTNNRTLNLTCILIATRITSIIFCS